MNLYMTHLRLLRRPADIPLEKLVMRETQMGLSTRSKSSSAENSVNLEKIRTPHRGNEKKSTRHGKKYYLLWVRQESLLAPVSTQSTPKILSIWKKIEHLLYSIRKISTGHGAKRHPWWSLILPKYLPNHGRQTQIPPTFQS